MDLIYQTDTSNWTERCKEAFNEIFEERYPKAAQKAIKLRAPIMAGDEGIPFAALIDPSNPDSGAYGGMSFVIFPVKESPCLISMCIGTQGLNPDENTLSRPGHARKINAVCDWLNSSFGNGQMMAWGKQDPVRVDIDIPSNVKTSFDKYDSIFKKYGKVLYAIFKPDQDKHHTEEALKAFLDLLFAERYLEPKAAHKDDYERIRSDYFKFLMPNTSAEELVTTLHNRKYVVLEGPPGTGKTFMAESILSDQYNKKGKIIQFHPNMTYENFIGGLAPVTTQENLGFRFSPRKGFLMDAVEQANKIKPEPYLLVIDEINRADLSKVLGEAIYLLEYQAKDREISLPYDFGEPFGDKLRLPSNLHLLGTMNSADRSIAVLDVAIRRRFAFVKLWPQMEVVTKFGGKTMQEFFKDTVTIFIEYAEESAFALVPGHTYFMEKQDEKARDLLEKYLIPLLEEYIAQGYVANFADAIRGLMQKIRSLKVNA